MPCGSKGAAIAPKTPELPRASLKKGGVHYISFVTRQDVHIEIETEGELTAGETVGYRKTPMRRSAPLLDAPGAADDAPFQPNAQAAVEVDGDRFLSFLIGRLAG